MRSDRDSRLHSTASLVGRGGALAGLGLARVELRGAAAVMAVGDSRGSARDRLLVALDPRRVGDAVNPVAASAGIDVAGERSTRRRVLGE